MEIFFHRKIIYIILFFSSTLLVTSEENNYCSAFTDCYKCVLCNDESKTSCECEWSYKGCVSPKNKNNNSQNNENWYSKILICQTLDRLNNVENIYCPKSLSKKTESSLDEDNSIKYSIQPDSNGFYGKDMAFCNFEFEQAAHKDIIVTVEFSSHIFKYPKVYIESTDIKNMKTKKSIDNDGDIEFDKNSKISIKVLLKQEYTISPITIKISIKTSNKILIIILVILILLILVFIVCVIFCINKINKTKEKKKKMRLEYLSQAFSNMAVLQNNNNIFINNNNSIDSVNLEKIYKQKLDNLFNNKMAKHLYKKEYNQYGGGCSICLEKFNEKSEVSITSCKHVFHYKCIHNWLYKNIKNIKCPNCNYELLKDKDENNSNEKEDNNIVFIRRRYRSNNSNNVDTNRNAITLNLHYHVYNGDSSQRQQISN